MTTNKQVDPLVLSETWERISADRAVTSGNSAYKQAYQLGMMGALIASMYCDLSAEQRAAFKARHGIVIAGQP